MLSAHFFGFVQNAPFYRALHREAVSLLPPGRGARWLDVGCGPGLVARLAANQGYHATGLDIDPAMIRQARQQARRSVSSAQFEEAGLERLVDSRLKADVVSAASLLAVLDDRGAAVRSLLACLKDDGVLLIIETTDAMKPRAARQWLKSNGYGERNWILLLWAWARRKGPVVSQAELEVPGYRVERVNLLGGLVAAWLVRRLDVPALLDPNDGSEK
jgi:ubiquinone/menaquinone biosynthesis C-methylase UbiE